MTEKYNIGSIFKFIIIVFLIAMVFYLITVFVTNNKKNEQIKDTEEAIIQYEEIIIGNMFNQKEEEYYVLMENKEDPYLEYYNQYITNYRSLDNALKVYSVDLSSAFNKKYISDQENISKDNLKVSKTTLIKIKNKDIIESYQGNEKIMDKLKAMSE